MSAGVLVDTGPPKVVGSMESKKGMRMPTAAEFANGDAERESNKATVCHQGKELYSLPAGRKAVFGRHSSCEIRLEGPKNAQGRPLLSRFAGVMWFRDGRLRVRNTSGHVVILESDTGESLTLEPRQEPALGPQGSVAGQSVRVSVIFSQWQLGTTTQLREELTVILPETRWLQPASGEETDGTKTVDTNLHATNAEERVLAALCRQKVIRRDKGCPALSLDDLTSVLGLSRSTVRGHLDSLRAKNGHPGDKDVLASTAYERRWVTMETLRRHGLV
jgi:DNA-binding transcriptional ArsR family regulator